MSATDLDVSIVVPTRRRPELLRETLSSIRVATRGWTNVEVVVADNDRNRGAEAVVREFGDLPIRYVAFEEELPMVENWNRAISLATKGWFTVLHDDDCLLPEAFQVMKPLLDRRDCTAVFGAAYTSPGFKQLPRQKWKGRTRYMALHAIAGPPTGNPGVFYRRSFVSSVGGYPSRNRLSADWELAALAAHYGKVVGVIRFVAWYRVHSAQCSTDVVEGLVRSSCLLRSRWARRGGYTAAKRIFARLCNERSLARLLPQEKPTVLNRYAALLFKHNRGLRVFSPLFVHYFLLLLGAAAFWLSSVRGRAETTDEKAA